MGGVPTTYLWNREADLPLLADDGTNACLHADGALAQLDGAAQPTYMLGDALAPSAASPTRAAPSQPLPTTPSSASYGTALASSGVWLQG